MFFLPFLIIIVMFFSLPHSLYLSLSLTLHLYLSLSFPKGTRDTSLTLASWEEKCGYTYQTSDGSQCPGSVYEEFIKVTVEISPLLFKRPDSP